MRMYNNIKILQVKNTIKLNLDYTIIISKN